MATYKKEQGQYMTPDRIVNMILDSVGFKGRQCLTSSIMEPSFGDGAFIVGIILRIIMEGKRAGLLNEEIAKIIHNNVYGIEKDTELYNKAIERLTALLAVYEIPSVSWDNLTNGDTLIEYKKHIGTKDYCVGNPPFVRIHNIPAEYREIINDFRFINGMKDLYIIFYEIGLYVLNGKGKLGYISPNSFLRNTSQKDFRKYLIAKKYISAIFDFKTSRLFEEADTYNCICILDKNDKRANLSVQYKEYQMYDFVAENTFDHDYFAKELYHEAWNLSSEEDIKFLAVNKMSPVKIHDIAVVQNGIVTNKDGVYIIKVFADKALSIPYIGKHTDIKKTVYFKAEEKTISIESTILHRCVKASRYDGVMNNTYIIFPYKVKKYLQLYLTDETLIKSGYEPFNEAEMKESFPKAYEYLSSMRGETLPLNRRFEAGASFSRFHGRIFIVVHCHF